MNLSAVLPAVMVAGTLALLMGGALGWAALRLRPDEDRLVLEIDALLPQTQCGQCLFPGCTPYARAIARREADIDRCPPGGDATIKALAELLGREPRPLNPDYGETTEPSVAFIDEQRCIGCALCFPACPVDAITGAPKFMHTVIMAQCTGCELCLPPCPVDCIEIRPRRDEARPGGRGQTA